MYLKNMSIRIITAFILVLFFFTVTDSISAAENEDAYIPNRYGVSAVIGETYHPSSFGINYYMLSGFILYDYEKIWKFKAPDQLRFKLEGSIGAAHYEKNRFVTSVNIFALRYLDFLTTRTFKPYLEGGIGLIYTDFQIPGQGLRINFNPQLGIGTEISTGSENTMFFSIRFHHISNGGLDDENRGLDSIMGMFGFYF